MPRILIEIPEEDFSVEEIRSNTQAVCQQLHACVKTEIENSLADPEAYVVEFDGVMTDHILGAVEPERLYAAAMQWNSDIRHKLLRAVGRLIEGAGNAGVARANSGTLWLNSSITYELKKAALAADNCFFDFAEDIVNLPNEMGYTYLSATISDRQLADVIAAPQRYAILPIWVK